MDDELTEKGNNAEEGSSDGSSDGSPTGHRLQFVLTQFHQTIEGIRELLDLVVPHLADETDGPSPALKAAVDRMTPEQASVALVVMTYMRRRDAPASQGDDEPSPSSTGGHAAHGGNTAEIAEDAAVSPSNGKVTDEFDDKLESLLKRAEADEVTDDEINDLVNEVFAGDFGTLWEFLRALQIASVDPDKQELLNRSMLITAVASFETLVAGVLGEQFRLFPGLLEREEKEFSLRDLQDFGSIEDARIAAIEQRVDSLMRQSLETWERWLEKQAGITVSTLCIDREAIAEVLQRRHVAVHNAGRVSRQYLASVPSSKASVGDWLPVRATYLEHALDELDVLGIGLVISAWCAWFGDEEELALNELNNRYAYTLLSAARYAASLKVSMVGLDLGGSGRAREVMRVNTWIARKQLESAESIHTEVAAWDTSALAPEFMLAEAALQDDFDYVFRELPGLVDRNAITVDNIEEWPLFREVRAHERYAELLAQLRPAGAAEDTKTNASGEDVAERPAELTKPRESKKPS